MQPPVNTQRLENIRSSSARAGFAAASPQHKARGQKRGSVPRTRHARKPPQELCGHYRGQNGNTPHPPSRLTATTGDV